MFLNHLQIIIDCIIGLIYPEADKDTHKDKGIDGRYNGTSATAIRGVIITIDIFESQDIIDAKNKYREGFRIGFPGTWDIIDAEIQSAVIFQFSGISQVIGWFPLVILGHNVVIRPPFRISVR